MASNHDKPYEHYPNWGAWGEVKATVIGKKPYQERKCITPGCKKVDRRYL